MEQLFDSDWKKMDFGRLEIINLLVNIDFHEHFNQFYTRNGSK